MSWSVRDYRHGKPDGEGPEHGPPPAQVFEDDLPLPTFAGMDEWEEDPGAMPGWESKLLRAQGMLSTRELDRFSWMVRRGIDAV